MKDKDENAQDWITTPPLNFKLAHPRRKRKLLDGIFYSDEEMKKVWGVEDTKRTELTLPDGVTEIGASSFMFCDSLATLVLPGSVQKIGEGAFDGCTSLAKIAFGGTAEQWKAVEKGSGYAADIPATSIHCTDGDVEIQKLNTVSHLASREAILSFSAHIFPLCM